MRKLNIEGFIGALEGIIEEILIKIYTVNSTGFVKSAW